MQDHLAVRLYRLHINVYEYVYESEELVRANFDRLSGFG